MRKNTIIKILRKFSAFLAALPLIFSFLLSYFQFPPDLTTADLSFDENGQFTILTISGLLEGERTLSSQTQEFLSSAISETKPDLVALLGNNILPSPFISDMFVAYTFDAIDLYCEFFNKTKTHFTISFGDLDSASLYDKSSQIKRFMRSKYFVGDIKNNNNLLTLDENNRDYAGNFRLSVLNEGKAHTYLYFIDYQNQSVLDDTKKEWIQRTSNKPSIFFSFYPLYQKNKIGNEVVLNFHFENDYTKALISGNFDLMSEYKNEGVDLLEIGQAGRLQGEEVERQNIAKKIVLTVDGELFYENY